MNTHILLSTDDPGVGGVAQYNHSIICGLAKFGYRVTCVQPQAKNDKLIGQQEQLGIQHLWINTDKTEDWHRTLTNLLNKPDLIICSNTNPFSNFAVKQIAIQLEIPYVVVEGLIEPHLAEQFGAYLYELSRHYVQAKSVIAVSHNDLQLLHKLFRLPKNDGQVIHYGRPSEYFRSRDLSVRNRLCQEFSIPADAVICFTSARIEKRKGYQYQLEAIRYLMQSSVWPQLCFVWAGGGIFEPQLEIQLKQAVEQLGITDKVKFLGQRSDVLDWLNAADIFVFPSELEGMPLCVMEAMAKGLPVVASAVSGIPEELGETGKLLPDPKVDSQATVRELVTTIETWVMNPDLRHDLGQACKRRAEKMFREERMFRDTVEVIEHVLLPNGDYVSPGFSIVRPDDCFQNMVVGDSSATPWPYLRRNIPHNWYVDKRQPTIGFLSRDEAHILYNTALKFKGKKALEIGCWLGWSACHLALAGVELDIIDPLLSRTEFYESVCNSLKAAGVFDSVNLVAGCSPQKVEELADHLQRKWPLIFIDGDHEATAPLNDAMICEQLAEADALILFHDLNSPDVAQGLEYLKQKGWQTMIYQTMQIMGVAWRGNIEPVRHQPDPKVYWELPEHLYNYAVSSSSSNGPGDEFQEILNAVRPFTLLSEARLFSLYSLAKQICLDDIPGDFVECGTYKGGSAALLAVTIKRYSLRPRLLYAFDTFEGMPNPTEVDRHKGIPANLTGFGAGTLNAPITENLDKICQVLKVRDTVVPVQGLFNQTLPQHKSKIDSIAFLHADGDWYESTLHIFNTFYDSVVPDGIIQVDDYGHWEGCRKAVHEFENSQGELFALHTIDETGVWFQKNESITASQWRGVGGSSKEKVFPIILVDGVFFQLYQTGIARVWQSLLEEWAESDFAKHVVVIDRAGTAPKISNIRYRSALPFDYSKVDADRKMIQQMCDEECADLFVSTYYTTTTSTPSVFMTYDMIPEVMGWEVNRPMWHEKHHAIQHASAYITISENTKRDLVKFFPHISSKCVTVALCGVKDTFAPTSTEEINSFRTQYGVSKPYFILVGIASGYKNTSLFFQAFNKICSRQGFDIVCTGSGALLEPEFRAYTSGSVVHMLQLSDEELQAAYSGAVALVYPSKYEGFGLPILEAMACGCPVITCPNASIPEVAGKAVLYVKDNDVNELVNALCDVQKPEIRESLIAAGLEQAKKFSWSKMAGIVSSALIDATLLPLKLRGINLIIFPDWSQPEDLVSLTLKQVVKAVATCPDANHITLLIEASDITEEDADLLLSGVSMNLLMEEDLNATEEVEISITSQLSQIQWSALLLRIQARIVLEHENKPAITQLKAEQIPAYKIENFDSIPRLLLDNCLNALCVPPQLFQDRRELDDYYQDVQRGMEYLHSNLFKNLSMKLWQDAASYFTFNANFLRLYFTEANLKDFFKKRAEIAEFALESLGYQLDYNFPEEFSEGNKVRLGIVCDKFEARPEIFATLPIFKHLNRDIFEITLYTMQTGRPRLERYFSGHADFVVQLPESLNSQVNTIRNDRLDIIFISPNITSKTNLITLLALHRLAPVQVVGMNNPVTTGMRNIDYYISGNLIEPEDAQQQYTETLVTLDGPAQCFDFATEEQIISTIDVSRESLGIEQSAVVYISGANCQKITPELEAAWAKIIAAVPCSKLLLYPFNPNWSPYYPDMPFKQRLASTFASYGLNEDRFIILEPVPNRADVKEYLQIGDVYLDSYPYSGMTSLIDPLEVGLPLVVRQGNCSRSRMGASLLRELQMPELIVENEENYVQLAVTLGTEGEWRKKKSAQIKQSMQRNPRFLNSRAYSNQIGLLFQNLLQKQQANA